MTNGIGCKCMAQSAAECACDADWTPAEVAELREQLADSQRIRKTLMECIENLKCCGNCKYWHSGFYHGIRFDCCHEEQPSGASPSGISYAYGEPHNICPSWELPEDWRQE